MQFGPLLFKSQLYYEKLKEEKIVFLQKILLFFHDAQSTEISWGTIIQVMVVEGMLGPGQKNRLERCHSRRLGFLHKLLSIAPLILLVPVPSLTRI